METDAIERRNIMKKYGAYTKEITQMIEKRLLDEIKDSLELYSMEQLSDVVREDLIALLDRMDGMRVLAEAIIKELNTDDE